MSDLGLHAGGTGVSRFVDGLQDLLQARLLWLPSRHRRGIYAFVVVGSSGRVGQMSVGRVSLRGRKLTGLVQSSDYIIAPLGRHL